MDKKLQDLTWSVLPKEFKEGVKKLYVEIEVELSKEKGATDNRTWQFRGMKSQLAYLFGIHNLTSDVEEEEMLTVPRKKVQDMYADIINDIRDYNGENPEMIGTTDPILRERAAGMKAQLRRLFGSKCLSDNVDSLKPKPAEPKFKVGDTASYVFSPTVKHKCTVTKVMQNEYSCEWEYNVMFEWGKPGMRVPESDLEPYTEPEEPTCTRTCTDDCPSQSRNLSQETANCDKCNDRRLHIAAMVMQGLLASPVDANMQSKSVDYIVKASFEYAEALIAESEKGGAVGNS